VCDFPPDIGNGTYTQSRGNSNGSVTTYTCNPGWYLNGTATVTCRDNGLWVGDIPNCFGKTLKPFYVSFKYVICTSLDKHFCISFVFRWQRHVFRNVGSSSVASVSQQLPELYVSCDQRRCSNQPYYHD